MIELVAYEPPLNEALFAFLGRCLPESGRSFDPEGRHAHLMRIEEAYEALWCLVEDGGEVVGCAGVRALDARTCELKTLFVFERLQGRGWGRRLAERAVAFARERGYDAVRLDTVSTSANAIALYRRLGFRDIDRYGGNPMADVFMELRLS
ncbi:GNAT family N-acetyltransferase [Eggerthella guodeyinii]|uniref:GNAT family N-acetyltransferase n=2 Tax=Eggerthella TaxID=84111 RepID=A0A6L7IQQ7_9ACTN|nr:MULTISPECIES: GNAT family N-acetyltransferase [Eggerthella]MBC5582890.1 GNAT family N-acetyltransferase [Eggerthella hominis]QOS69839.1 GNAT family N-acetyltransferase [Eggerthella guodeyinii]